MMSVRVFQVTEVAPGGPAALLALTTRDARRALGPAEEVNFNTIPVLPLPALGSGKDPTPTIRLEEDGARAWVER
jgi:hypothetical protein